MYTYDMPEEREGLYAAFVGSTEALAVIRGVDASEALSMPGVVAVLDACDVPGENKSDVEEVFASKKVRWAGVCRVTLGIRISPTCRETTLTLGMVWLEWCV